MNMNDILMAYQYNLAIVSRELLELVNIANINMEAFEARGKFFKNIISESAVTDFFTKYNPNETSLKFLKQLNETYEDVYEQKKYLVKGKDRVYTYGTDQVKIIDTSLNLYTISMDVIEAFLHGARESGISDPEIEELVERERKLYTYTVLFGIYNAFVDVKIGMIQLNDSRYGSREIETLKHQLEFVKKDYCSNRQDLINVCKNVESTLKLVDSATNISNEYGIREKLKETTELCINCIQKASNSWTTLYVQVMEKNKVINN